LAGEYCPPTPNARGRAEFAVRPFNRMKAEQTDQSNPRSGRRKRKRAPKVRSKRGRGGDHVSPAFQREQARIDAEIYKLVAEGFQLAQAASALGVGEDRAGTGYRRAVASLRLATVEESRGHALARLHQRRRILHAEILKRQKQIGDNPAELFDSGELQRLFEIAHQLDTRESRLMGLDAPNRLAVAWTGVAPGNDLITDAELNNLSEDELRDLFDLLNKARNPRSVEVESTPIPPAPTNLTEQPEPATRPDWMAEAMKESDERFAPQREAEAIIARLNATDPVMRVSDPAERDALAKKANAILERFNSPPWTEWMRR
jgi:hypothetical protein